MNKEAISTSATKHSPTKFWIVVKTKSRAEKKVNERLLDNGFNSFLPTTTTLKVWSDRKKKVTSPLIASTLFVQTDAKSINAIYSIQGVHSILKHIGKPAIVKDVEIENLKILHGNAENIQVKTAQKFEKGDLVTVTNGPFQGLLANIVQDKSNFRLLVEIDSVGLQFIVDVPKSFVSK